MSYVWRDIEAEQPISDTIRAGIAAADRRARRQPLATGSVFPLDAVARISKPSRSVMTSGKARTKSWVLRFDRRTPPFIEPLMGWTGGDDTLVQVELSFPTLESAIAYAERQGLTYVVEGAADERRQRRLTKDQDALDGQGLPTSDDVFAAYLSLALAHARYGRCDLSATPDLERALINPAAVFAAPSEVVSHPGLTSACKREILTRWAWDEYLLQLATEEAMPEGREPSRLDEVRTALLALNEADRANHALILHMDRGAARGRP